MFPLSCFKYVSFNPLARQCPLWAGIVKLFRKTSFPLFVTNALGARNVIHAFDVDSQVIVVDSTKEISCGGQMLYDIQCRRAHSCVGLNSFRNEWVD